MLSSHALGRQRILGQTPRLLKDLQAIGVLQQLHVIAASPRNPVVVGCESNIAILVGAPLMLLVRRGKVARQLVQIETFVIENLSRNQTRLGLRTMFHPLGGPLLRLLVEVF